MNALRQTTFATIPVKELSVVAWSPRTLCTDVGNQPEQRKVVTSEPLSADSRTMLELVRLGGQPEPWLRIRRPGDGCGQRRRCPHSSQDVRRAGVARGRPVELAYPHADRRRHGDSRDGRNNAAPEWRRQHRHQHIVEPLTRSGRPYPHRRLVLLPTSATCAHWGPSSPDSSRSSSLRSRSCCRGASMKIRLPRSSARSRLASSWHTISRSSTSARASCAEAEVLIRWRKPDGTIRAARFIHTAGRVQAASSSN